MTPAAYVLQRLSAVVLAPLVIGHLVMMIVAVQGGLTAAEILARTQGSWLWGGFYGLFVVAASVHVSVGLANVLSEWTPLPRGAVVGLGHGFAALTLLLGLRAVYAVIAP